MNRICINIQIFGIKKNKSRKITFALLFFLKLFLRKIYIRTEILFVFNSNLFVHTTLYIIINIYEFAKSG